jgi:hypothetical protein
MGRVRPGDQIACVASREWNVLAFGQITSELYEDDQKIFLKGDVFPFRFKFNAKLLPSERQIDIKSVILQFSIVRNPLYWGAYFKASPTQIAKSDWHLLQDAVYTHSGGTK